MMLIVAWPRSYWIDSRWCPSADRGATRAIVAAEVATCPAHHQTLDSATSCSRSVQTTKSQRCWSVDEGDRRAASRIPVEVLAADRRVRVGADVPPGPDRVPRLHVDLGGQG
jgi:hypothetical protein